MVAGQELTPRDAAAVARLKRYWAGEGSVKWAGSPRPYTTLVGLLRKYIRNDRQLKGFAAEVFHMRLGFWPGTPHRGSVPTPGAKR